MALFGVVGPDVGCGIPPGAFVPGAAVHEWAVYQLLEIKGPGATWREFFMNAATSYPGRVIYDLWPACGRLQPGELLAELLEPFRGGDR